MAVGKFKYTYTLFIGSVIFVILAIGLISLLGSTGSSAPATDTRAKAGIVATLKLSGIVSTIDETTNTFVVDNLQFPESQKNLGTWTVTPPQGFNIFSITPGTKLTLTVNPTTFLAASHTLTATQIKIEK